VTLSRICLIVTPKADWVSSTATTLVPYADMIK
jgi:hypothetical protein